MSTVIIPQPKKNKCQAHTCFKTHNEDELHVSRSIAQLQRHYNF